MSIMIKFELLPNEIFIECFQYLNAPDIFYSFDRLNNRFSTLIQNIPLHLDFQDFKKSRFYQFCHRILSIANIQHQIISLKLSNEDTFGQIEEFLSLFSLSKFINLRSLSLIHLTDYNIAQLLPMLPFLTNLYYFSFTDFNHRILDILCELSTLKLRILSIPNFAFGCTYLFKDMLITSLTISDCDLYDLYDLFKYTTTLKYLKIKKLDNSRINRLSKFSAGNFVYLKQLIVDYYVSDFKYLEVFLPCLPNLRIFTINAPHHMDMIDADRWQYLIESSLTHLRVFNFYFSFIGRDCYNNKLNKVKQFQTDFWCKHHHWYTNYEITHDSATIYTMPYVWNEYTLVPTMNRYSYSNEFDNVTQLFLSRMTIKDNSSYYFKNVESLLLTNDCDDEDQLDENKLKIEQIKFLNNIVNLSNIKNLGIEKACDMLSSSLLLKILKELPYVSSLGIDQKILIPFPKDRELREYLNQKITALNLASYSNKCSITSFEVALLCETFSNLEQLYCYIGKLDDLSFILEQCSKLSMITIQYNNQNIFSWYKMNALKLNVYIEFIQFQK